VPALFLLQPLQSPLEHLEENLGLYKRQLRNQCSEGGGCSLDSYNAQCGLIVIFYGLRFINIRACQTNLISDFDSVFQGNVVDRVNWYFRNTFYRPFGIALLE